MARPRLFRAVYGGGLKGGSWSKDAKLKTVKRLLRMVVRLLLGSGKMAEYDAMVDRFERLSPAEMEAETERLKTELVKRGLNR